MLQTVQPTPGEVRALANRLLSWADQLAGGQACDADRPSDGSRHDSVVALASVARDIRRGRTETFPQLRLREPMWDVMLDLFVEQESGCRVSLDCLILAAESEAAVIRHAVAVLVTSGLVERTADRFDERIVWLTLSPAGHAGMVEHLTLAADCVHPLPAPRPCEALAAA